MISQNFRTITVRRFSWRQNVNGSEFVDAVKKARADIAVSINWPTLIRGKALAAFSYGILNAHTGDLPRYRGNACANWAIIAK